MKSVIEINKIMESGMVEIPELTELVNKGYKKFIRETSFRMDNQKFVIFHKVLNKKNGVISVVEEILNFIKTRDEGEKIINEAYRVIRISTPTHVIFVDENEFKKTYERVPLKGHSFDKFMIYMFSMDKGFINKDGKFSNKVYIIDESRLKNAFIETYVLNGLSKYFDFIENFVSKYSEDNRVPEDVRKHIKKLLPHDLVKKILL